MTDTGPARTVEAILFDLYDTLVEPDWSVLQRSRDALATELGTAVDLAREQWKKTHDARMRGLHGGLEGDLEAVFKACGLATDPTVLRSMAQRELANWAEGVRLYGDVVPELTRLRAAGYRLAIASNASREAASVVAALGLDLLVDAVAVSCEVGALKPEPALLHAALDRLDVEPSRALLVDDITANLDAATKLGLRAIRISRRDGCPEPGASSEGTHACVRDLAGLRQLLEPDRSDALSSPVTSSRRADAPA